ncbi:hypothetical protein C8F01DRAFT_1339419 [Mycena amicta]|nr:hypothetical protein C8F01DRAFT_1339419 [Mycena amicta]
MPSLDLDSQFGAIPRAVCAPEDTTGVPLGSTSLAVTGSGNVTTCTYDGSPPTVCSYFNARPISSSTEVWLTLLRAYWKTTRRIPFLVLSVWMMRREKALHVQTPPILTTQVVATTFPVLTSTQLTRTIPTPTPSSAMAIASTRRSTSSSTLIVTLSSSSQPTAPVTNSTSSSLSNSSPSTGTIIGAIFGATVGLLLFIGLVWVLRSKCCRRRPRYSSSAGVLADNLAAQDPRSTLALAESASTHTSADFDPPPTVESNWPVNEKGTRSSMGIREKERELQFRWG